MNDFEHGNDTMHVELYGIDADSIQNTSSPHYHVGLPATSAVEWTIQFRYVCDIKFNVSSTLRRASLRGTALFGYLVCRRSWLKNIFKKVIQ